MRKINIFLFTAAIFAAAVLNLLSPKTQDISETENRKLAGRPEATYDSLISGKYFRDYESFFKDHFVYRENLVKASKAISSLKGIKREEEVKIVDFGGQNVGGGGNDEGNDGETAANTKGNLLILNDKVMELYKFNETKSKAYADMLNTTSEKMGEGIKVYSALVPVQIEFLEEKKYRELSDSQIDGINFVNSSLSDNVTSVDVYHPIQEHIDEYVYFRTDHHWTALGAYYGYTAFAESAGFDALPLDNFKKDEAPGFLGHLSTVNPSEKVTGNPDTVVYYTPPVKSDLEVFFYDKETGVKKSYKGAVINKTYIDNAQKYGIFMGGDFPLGVVKTASESGKKIMVIKDSYGNAFLPFLVPHYSEIYVVDPRHYKENIVNLAKENNIDEVLFLNYILTTNFDSYMNSVRELMK